MWEGEGRGGARYVLTSAGVLGGVLATICSHMGVAGYTSSATPFSFNSFLFIYFQGGASSGLEDSLQFAML